MNNVNVRRRKKQRYNCRAAGATIANQEQESNFVNVVVKIIVVCKLPFIAIRYKICVIG